MFHSLSVYLTKPMLYTPSTAAFWDDEHISNGMLEAHLSPVWDAATRNHAFIDASVKWISQVAPLPEHKFLLDLGCGPGLYAERFSRAGYFVTGVDFSKRSVAYAREQALLNHSNVEYHYQNYLTIGYVNQFDVITLIYCDYAALSITDRLALLKKIHQALKPGGKFIFDVFTPCMRKGESRTWNYYENGGFYSEKPHMCLESVYQYNDGNTELRQYIVQTGDTLHCYNIWDHYFTKEALISELQPVGFASFTLYGDVAGKVFSETGETICGIFVK